MFALHAVLLWAIVPFSDENGCSKAHIADLLRVSEGTVRYHVKRIEAAAHDGRADQARVAAEYAETLIGPSPWLPCQCGASRGGG